MLGAETSEMTDVHLVRKIKRYWLQMRGVSSTAMVSLCDGFF